MREDVELVDLAVQGDSAAFEELYERYFDRVFDFLARMVRSEAEAADLAQDTFIRAMNSLGSLTKGASFKSWLFTIARNTALNRIERNSRLTPLQGRSEDDDEPSFDVVDGDRFSDPEQAAEANDLAAYVWEAAKGLEPSQYAVLDLSVRQGLDSAEIADVLGVTKNNAYVMVNRLKKSLEDAIGALVLFKSGRGSCPELDAALTKLELGEMSPEARRLIDRHSNKCAVCSEKKKRMASPFAIFGAFGMVQPTIETKTSILEGLLQSYPYAGATASAGGGEGSSGWEQGTGNLEQGSPGGDAMAVAGRSGGGAGAGVLGGCANLSDDEDGSSRKGLLKIALGAAAVLLIGLTSYVVVSGQDGGGESVQPLAIVQSPSATPASATAVPGTATPEQTATAEVTATGEATETPPPPTPVAVEPGPQEPGIAAPPDGPPPGPQAQEPGPTGPAIADPPPGSEPPPPPPPPPPCVPGIAPSTRLLDFGARQSSLSFSLGGNNCGEPAEYQAAASEAWLMILPAAGRVTPGGSASITVRVDRDLLREYGSATVEISGAWGSVSVAVRVSEELTVRPTSTPTPFGLTIKPTQGLTILPTRTPTPPCSSVICN